jgi:LemA protein
VSSIVAILAVVVIVPITVAVGAYLARHYRRLVALRLEVDRAWADLDVLLRRRHDEILDLAETIRAVGGEPAVAIGIASRFASIEPWLSRAARYEAEQRINVSVSRLLILLSYHPYLRRNDRFASVRQRFMMLDEHIGSCRERYNGLVTIGNAHCERLSDRLLAAQAGLRPRFLLRAASDERRAAATGPNSRPERDRANGRLTSRPLSPVVLSPRSTAVELLP